MSFVHEFVQGTSPLTLLMLHGTGGDERDLLSLGRAVSPDASLLSPLGKVREGTMPRFFRRVSEGVFDMKDLVFRTNELADWLDEASVEHGINPNHLVAVGYSNGATMVSSLLLLRPETISGGIALRPSVPFVPEVLPDLHGKRVLLVPGDQDPVVPPSQAYEVARILELAGATPTVAQMEAGHGLGQKDADCASRWLVGL